MIEPVARRRGLGPIFAVVAVLATAQAAPGQMTSGDSLSKILTDPDKLEELKKERLRPPIEFFRSQVMPNDVLPYIKANHWAMIGLEMRSNHDDYDGSLQSRPVGLAGQPHEIVYRRDARLVKTQRARITMPILLPAIPKEMGFQLIRPEAIRQDEEWLASLRPLEPHQQMIVVMTRNANDPYARWGSMRSTLPSSARKDDQAALEKQRYYRMVLPLEPDKPLLSPHPLTWSAISHVIWDGLPPENIGTGQQQAMVDWLHFGGQLIIVGGAGPTFAPLRESFLAPYLPADSTGENVMKTGDELRTLAEAYRPTTAALDPDDPQPLNQAWSEAWQAMARRYRPPAPIITQPKKPLFVAALKPRPGATAIPLGGPDAPPLAVEWRVGRGRVIMFAVGLTEPELVGWAGFDTMIRRVALRRPEERLVEPLRYSGNGAGILPPRYEALAGPDLTGVRYLARDLGAPTRTTPAVESPTANQGYTVDGDTQGPTVQVPVGEWLDNAELPSLARDRLEKASGIEIPNSRFVLKVILAYIFALVPLNWLICRYLIRRREWAWVIVPALSMAFAVGVERAAAYDVGYDSSCDEVDLIETHGDYPRGHVSRFASIYSTGRTRYTISYPKDPTALALPLATGRSLRGEDIAQSSFQTMPNPALSGFQVQPRSLAMFRAEQMASLPGTVSLVEAADGTRTIANNSGFDLEDAWVVEVRPSGSKRRAVPIGPIAEGEKAPVGALVEGDPKAKAEAGQLEPGPFHQLLLDRAVATIPEEVGELRLIAVTRRLFPGQEIEPAVDRHRGFTLVVAHLKPAPLIPTATARYNALAAGADKMPTEPPAPVFVPNPGRMRGGQVILPPAVPGGATAIPLPPPPSPPPTSNAPENPSP